MRWRGDSFQGNASVIWRAIHSAVGFCVTLIQTSSLRSSRTTTKALCFVLNVLISPFKSTSRLEAENAALRHQVVMLRRIVHRRVRLTNSDRMFFIQLY